ncbi:enterotoxin A family protein [Paraburkholderia solisilvae]|nr:enterotoxin A family protein [Paraburkholderia solisilvae]
MRRDAEAATRVPRGGTLRKCAEDSPFRECRGGEGLRATAWSYVPFDQIRYVGEPHIGGRGSCEGWVREAMRRIDRGLATGPVSLLDVVHAMRRDTTSRRSGVAGEMFSRVGGFQLNSASLGLQRFRLMAVEQFNPRGSDDVSIDSMATVLGSELRENEIAFVRLLLNPAASGGERFGHALLVQHLPQDEFVIFDPNNGAFLYRGAAQMQSALRAYAADAFSEEELGLHVVPHSMDSFSASLPALGTVAMPGSTPSNEPPLLAVPHTLPATPALYEEIADESNGLSGEALAGAAGGERALANAPQGVAYYALREVARGRVPNLTEATEQIREQLADYVRRTGSIREIRRLQEENRHGLITDLPNRTRRPGSRGIHSGQQLVSDLRLHFGSSRDAENHGVAYLNDFAEIRLTFRRPQTDERVGAVARRPNRRAADAYSIVVQRRGLSADFMSDRYEMHDPASGVYRFSDFNELAAGLTSAMLRGYPEAGGIDHADTVYFGHYDDNETALHALRGRPAQHDSRGANISLGETERRLDVTGFPSQTPPLEQPTPEPDFGYGEPRGPVPKSGRQSHDELKRSWDPPRYRKPYALFRPSTLTPDDLAERGGFDCERTTLRNVNLDLHDFDLASQPGLIDSAGYLGTFRDERTAAARLSSMAPDGYIYFVAPTPNMVDVNASLGSQARAPETAELAAMGRIDYAQIRGWREVKNGVEGEFVRNRAYRWDVFNQTETAGTQPQLARFPIANDAWQATSFGSFVAKDNEGKVTKFNQDPNRVHAFFYDNAWEKVRNLHSRQALGLDYRGPFTIEAYAGDSSNGTHLYVARGGWPYVSGRTSSYSRDPKSRHTFTMGDDGRLHLADDHDQVLRVNGDGNVYLGGTPSNLRSSNGVFDFVGSNLIHREDNRFLTTGISVWTPFLSGTIAGARSRWALRKPDGTPARPPTFNQHTFAGKTGGQYSLYRFEKDPDSALPLGATHFVTAVPVDPHSGDFANLHALMTPAEVRDVSAWLSEQNAAWLFRDGFYLTSPEPGHLRASTLDSLTRWWAAYDPSSGKAEFSSMPVASNYRIGREAWQRVRDIERRHDAIFKMLA